MKMQRVPFNNTGKNISQIALGTMWMGTLSNVQTSTEILNTYVEYGGNIIDTANCYAWWSAPHYVGDESEFLLGQWIKERRNRRDIFLASKMGARPRNPARLWDDQGNSRWDIVKEEFEYLSAATIRSAVENSLRRLQTDYLDLYYVHLDDPVTPMEETLQAMHELVLQGKVLHIGCSNFTLQRLQQARKLSELHNWYKYVAIQQEYSYFQPKANAELGSVTQHADAALFSYLQKQDDLTLFAYSPLLKGIYDNAQKRAAYYNWSQFDTLENQSRLDVLTRIAGELNITNNELVLAWMLQQPKTIPILGASSAAQLKNNLKVLGIRLSETQLNILNNPLP